MPLALPDSNVAQLKYSLQQICVTFGLYGVQAALFMATVPVLARRRASARMLLTAVIALNLTTTIGVGALIANHLITVPTLGPRPSDVKPSSFFVYLLFTTSTRLSFLLSDGLVVWRAWVMWPRNSAVRGIVIACMISSVVGVVLDGVWYMKYIWSAEPSILTLTFSIPVLVTNLVSTTLVGMQVWFHRRDISVSVGAFSTRSKVGGALMLLFESGLAYCALCAIILVFDILTPNAIIHVDSEVVFRSAIPLFTSLYPLVVILIISVQQQAIADGMDRAGPSFWESIHFRIPSGNAGPQAEDVSTEMQTLR